MKMTKKRLDELLVERNLVENTDLAKRLIMAGLVFSEHERLDKPGVKIDPDMPIRIKQKNKSYVSRGGLKLEKAIQQFDLNLEGKTILDIGSSTGGFTDCALQHGAKLSYAIDVGYNQLDWKLRNDKRVVVMERTNFRYVTKDMLNTIPNFASIDVSFISLRLILPVLKYLLDEENDVVALIKPQFEARKEQVGEGGIVREKQVHVEVLEQVIRFAAGENFILHGITYSPITGSQGNVEFLAHFKYLSEQKEKPDIPPFEKVVEQAHQHLVRMEAGR
ncbi:MULTISPECIES: TlyA family RNA methyltransferase [Oceanobacillus]|nr:MULTISPECIES: TlyA family RNA methyltransferase [Oceanobacillus]